MDRLLHGRSSRRDLAVVTLVATTASLPAFLVAALAVQVRSSLHFGASAQGVTLAVYYLGAAVVSVPGSRLAEHFGALRVMKAVAAADVVLLALIGGAARSWGLLTVLLALAGMASSIVQPAANQFISRQVPTDRQGLAFGIKQSAIPLSSLLGGLAVPAIGVTIGWQWAFGLAAVVALSASLAVPRPTTTLAARRASMVRQASSRPMLPLVVLTVGFGLGICAASGVSAFLATASVASGLSKADAGLVVALASAAALVSRVLTGVQADRRGRGHFRVVAVMLAVGAVADGLLALGAGGHAAGLFVVASAFAFGAGWGWNGLFNFAVVRTHPELPARATGISQVGGRLGGVLGPLVVGLVVEHGSYSLAFGVVAGLAGLGALTVLAGRELLVHSRVAMEMRAHEAGPK